MNAPLRRALLSVSDKTGIAELARTLQSRGVELLSTGGTAKLLLQLGIPVREVADYTGFPEIMDGRVKTLHPRIHGGLLGRRGVDDAVMAQHDIGPIDLLVVNLYPFAQTIARAEVTADEAIENIDIGGPAMLRGAAKNHADVAVVVDPSDYAELERELAANDGATTRGFRERLAAKAFAHTASYDSRVAEWLAQHVARTAETFPATLNVRAERLQTLRYGENPHQKAAFYRDSTQSGGIAAARFLQGKELSYNNIADADSALECVRQFDAPACVIVKHSNPCGVAVAASVDEAYEGAYRTDPTSAFGGVLAFNREVDVATLTKMLARQFVEVLIAPSFANGCDAVYSTKPNIRVLVTGPLRAEDGAGRLELRSVHGGLLVQSADHVALDESTLRCVTKRQPTADERRDLLFAWRVCQYVKSNAIVFARDSATVGVGAGQMSRVYSSRIAAIKAADAKLEIRGAAMASDAFFPFRDGVDVAAEQGVRAVIQPGGAMRDAEVIAAADEHGIAMLFTGVRHFRH
ncbi:MAG: bifunctional phosphoribosylaminoimidazolecarboxamide formyltransferase/IMP cyclohydrolase [Steroidobacteraceae bacterium]